LAEFDSYLGQKAVEEAAAAQRDFMAAVSDIRGLVIMTKPNVAAMLAGYATLTSQGKDNAETIGAFFKKADERLQIVKLILDERAYNELGALEALPASPAQLLDEQIATLNAEIADLDRLERDDTAARLRAQQYAELADRKKLSEGIDLVVERRNQLEERHRISACRAQCRLTAITQQITRRRREPLTPSLKTALEDELKALKLTHIPLDLTDRGDLGNSIVEVALSAQQRIAHNSEVLSEGEQRGLALGCFLAELSEIGGDHGIVVDDPVSSLDHYPYGGRRTPPRRGSSEGRQAIVFTQYSLSLHARYGGSAVPGRMPRRVDDKPWQQSLRDYR
jgi:hypothetical protein